MVLVWQPITDLPEDWPSLTEGELGPLLQFWNDQRADLKERGALDNFTQRLAREWSIETGQIEGVYDIDRGITATLIERGINADLIPPQPGQKPPELIAAIIQDHADVLEGLFQFVRGERPLSKSYVHELHAALLKHQETTLVMDQFGNFFDAKLIKGRYKEQPNNPRRPDGNIHQYCPLNQVDPEMERMLTWHTEHEKKNVPVEVEAAWLHHRFTQIHPYQDGNGRVARALASLVFLKAGWFPLVVTREDRSRYIGALEVADDGDLRSLVAVFVDIEKRALFQATQAAADIQHVYTVDEAVAAAKRALADPGKRLGSPVWKKDKDTKDTADRLMIAAEVRLKQVAESLSREIGDKRPDFQFSSGSGQINSSLQPELGYSPNTLNYKNVRQLLISGQNEAYIQVQAHAIGPKFRGLIGIVTIFQPASGPAVLASNEVFQVNYAESCENAQKRFGPWLENSLVKALTLWRKSL